MNTLRLLSIACLAVVALPAAAAEPYAGLSLATPGEATITAAGKTPLNNDNSPHAFKLYGGLKLTDEWAVEVGYGVFGSYHFSDPGTGFHARESVSAVTGAARYSLSLGESFAVFGKLGLAVNRMRFTNSLGMSTRESFVRPLWGFGVEYRLTRQLAVPLEFEYLGHSHKQGDFRQQKLEIGLRYQF
ncbi:MAG: outer membrane beta-barrel protein [Burkholderiales bacterium]|nr:outer membrane beta-barrel protein [Burkholderiales bacterium]